MYTEYSFVRRFFFLKNFRFYREYLSDNLPRAARLQNPKYQLLNSWGLLTIWGNKPCNWEVLWIETKYIQYSTGQRKNMFLFVRTMAWPYSREVSSRPGYGFSDQNPNFLSRKSPNTFSTLVASLLRSARIVGSSPTWEKTATLLLHDSDPWFPLKMLFTAV